MPDETKEQPKGPSLKEMQAELAREEAKTGSSGAIPRTPKQNLLDARDVEAKHPDHYVRWLNTDGDKVQSRQADGFEKIPESEGGRQTGRLALFKQPREQHEKRVRDQKETAERRLTQHNQEVEAAAETIAKHLRDRHGVRIDARDFLISER
jgi:hypothetical protein